MGNPVDDYGDRVTTLSVRDSRGDYGLREEET